MIIEDMEKGERWFYIISLQMFKFLATLWGVLLCKKRILLFTVGRKAVYVWVRRHLWKPEVSLQSLLYLFFFKTRSLLNLMVTILASLELPCLCPSVPGIHTVTYMLQFIYYSCCEDLNSGLTCRAHFTH